MGVFNRFFAPSPFIQLHEHAKKVHECVELIRPLANALLAEDYEKIEQLHDVMSRTEHEADEIKTELRDKLAKLYFLSVGQNELNRFLAYQDDIADAAEDFAVLLVLRKTKVPKELQAGFMAFVEQVISVSEQLLNLEKDLTTLAEAAFTGEEAENVLKGIENIFIFSCEILCPAGVLQKAMLRSYGRIIQACTYRLGLINLAVIIL